MKEFLINIQVDAGNIEFIEKIYFSYFNEIIYGYFQYGSGSEKARRRINFNNQCHMRIVQSMFDCNKCFHPIDHVHHQKINIHFCHYLLHFDFIFNILHKFFNESITRFLTLIFTEI